MGTAEVFFMGATLSMGEANVHNQVQTVIIIIIIITITITIIIH